MSDTITCEWCAEEIPAGSSRCPKCQGTISRAGQRVQGTPLAKRQEAAQPVKSKPPAGWYNHPTMADTRRYWDGNKWTEHIAPGSVAPAPAPAPATGSASVPRKDEPAFAWTLALLPLVWIVLDLTVPKVAIHPAAWIGLVVVTIILAELDARWLRRRGVDIGNGTAVGVPFYLIKRTKEVGSTAFIPIVWFVAVAGAVLSWYLPPGVYDFPSNVISSDIQKQLKDQTDQTYSVKCPEAHNVSGGDSITCVTTDQAGQVGRVVVDFDSKGSYVWQVAR